jgi:hypothetical protein
MEVKKYDNSWLEKWNNFLDDSKNGSFLFKREFMEYHADKFNDYSLIVVDENKPIGLLPANLRDNIVYSHQGLSYGGFIVNCNIKMPKLLEAFKATLSFLHNNEIQTLILKNIPYIYHRYPADEIEWALTCVKANLYRRDSTLSIQNKNPLPYQERRQRSIKKAQKLNPIVCKNEPDGLDKFWLHVLEPNMLKKHDLKPVHSLEEIKLLTSRFPENIVHYNIYIADQIMAGCTMFLNSMVAHAQYISGTEEGRANGCLDYLFNYLIEKEYNKYPYFDFGNSNEDSGMKINLGLMGWKEGFGGRAISHDFYEINTENYYLLEEIYTSK